jgi:hypothetical protein
VKASRGPFVLASHYDGIDLAGDLCRPLVLDFLPTATNSYELFRAEVLRGNSLINVGLAQRIEQAIGRDTRGSGDYCAVFLLEKVLMSWIARSAKMFGFRIESSTVCSMTTIRSLLRIACAKMFGKVVFPVPVPPLIRIVLPSAI